MESIEFLFSVSFFLLVLKGVLGGLFEDLGCAKGAKREPLDITFLTFFVFGPTFFQLFFQVVSGPVFLGSRDPPDPQKVWFCLSKTIVFHFCPKAVLASILVSFWLPFGCLWAPKVLKKSFRDTLENQIQKELEKSRPKDEKNRNSCLQRLPKGSPKSTKNHSFGVPGPVLGQRGSGTPFLLILGPLWVTFW